MKYCKAHLDTWKMRYINIYFIYLFFFIFYLKADYKLHILEESPCADHCIRFALSTDDAHFKSACDHDHSMECDRCLDCKKAPNDIFVGRDSEDICYM